MSNYVFVLDPHQRPLSPVHPGEARHLLNQGQAAVFRRYPFTIILKQACPNTILLITATILQRLLFTIILKQACPNTPIQPLELKLDPGSKVTGIAIKQGNQVIFGAELQHRGEQIKEALLSRRHDKFGFPTRHRSQVPIHKGFQTGDIVTATVTAGKKIGSYVGRVLCRASGSFDVATTAGRVAGISHKYCAPVHKQDGYAYGC